MYVRMCVRVCLFVGGKMEEKKMVIENIERKKEEKGETLLNKKKKCRKEKCVCVGSWGKMERKRRK